jgi:hypothetical protein
MKASEFINENKKRKSFRKSFTQAAPNHLSYDFLDSGNHPYLAYRFGVALAGSPDIEMDKYGPVGGRLNMVDYTDADKKIRQGAEKFMGVKPSNATGKGSAELDTTTVTSLINDKLRKKK